MINDQDQTKVRDLTKVYEKTLFFIIKKFPFRLPDLLISNELFQMQSGDKVMKWSFSTRHHIMKTIQGGFLENIDEWRFNQLPKVPSLPCMCEAFKLINSINDLNEKNVSKDENESSVQKSNYAVKSYNIKSIKSSVFEKDNNNETEQMEFNLPNFNDLNEKSKQRAKEEEVKKEEELPLQKNEDEKEVSKQRAEEEEEIKKKEKNNNNNDCKTRKLERIKTFIIIFFIILFTILFFLSRSRLAEPSPAS